MIIVESLYILYISTIVPKIPAPTIAPNINMVPNSEAALSSKPREFTRIPLTEPYVFAKPSINPKVKIRINAFLFLDTLIIFPITSLVTFSHEELGGVGGFSLMKTKHKIHITVPTMA